MLNHTLITGFKRYDIEYLGINTEKGMGMYLAKFQLSNSFAYVEYKTS